MRFIVAKVAVLVLISGVSMAFAQSIASVGGPRELPPANFTGQQYVDSRGCVFLRAGYGGQTNWVPRVNAQRKALCGFPPTFGRAQAGSLAAAPQAPPRADRAASPPQTAAQAQVAAEPAAVPPARAARTPAQQKAATTVSRDIAAGGAAVPLPPVRVTASAQRADSAAKNAYEKVPNAPGIGKIGCFKSAPVAEVVRLQNGGTAVVCTRGDGGVSGWRSPVFAKGAPVGAALNYPGEATTANRGSATTGMAPQATARGADQLRHPPKGYKLAWTDDRLNPRRGIRTAQGDAAQNQIWTQEVPARLVANHPAKKARVTVSTKSTPGRTILGQPERTKRTGTANGTMRARFLQIGTFGVAVNAEEASARLATLGLPVARQRLIRGGRTFQVVVAGPFGTAEAAQAALSSARQAGFLDAFFQ